MDKKNKNRNAEKIIALKQIIILIVAIFAFSYAVGSEVGVVEAQISPRLLNAKFLGGGPPASSEIPAWLQLWGEGTASAIASVAVYVAASYLVVSSIVKYAGSEKDGYEAVQRTLPAALAGTGVYFGAGAVLPSTGLLAALGPIFFGVVAFLWAIGYEDDFTRTIDFTCKPWDAPSGGDECEECNRGLLPCTEYQCMSLGQGCKLVNKGTSNELCVWVKVDPNPPVITPREESLLANYAYTPDGTISPPDRGVIIRNEQEANGCVPPFTELQFGISVNKPSRCKIDYIRQSNFSRMRFDFGESSLKLYNHTQVIKVPGSDSTTSPILVNGEMNSLYVRCEDENGVSNPADFVFKFCVDPGPDNDYPIIESTSINSGGFVQAGVGSVDLGVYTNEPANCKWDILDRNYEDMTTQMTCLDKPVQKNARTVFPCSTTLTGIKDRQDNQFYFRCEDKSERKNKNPVSYPFILKGSQALTIGDVGPNGTIKDSTDTVRVKLTAKTLAGAESGKAICQYSDTGDEGDYINFFKTGSFSHEQELGLSQGDYIYYIKCFDAGGNSDTKTVDFKVETDTSVPAVVRAFHDGSYLKIITNEPAECVYDTFDCSYGFDDGIAMTSTGSNEQEHYTNWNTAVNFYIKCRDDYGNEPSQCSIIARPFNL